MVKMVRMVVGIVMVKRMEVMVKMVRRRRRVVVIVMVKRMVVMVIAMFIGRGEWRW